MACLDIVFARFRRKREVQFCASFLSYPCCTSPSSQTCIADTIATIQIRRSLQTLRSSHFSPQTERSRIPPSARSLRPDTVALPQNLTPTKSPKCTHHYPPNSPSISVPNPNPLTRMTYIPYVHHMPIHPFTHLSRSVDHMMHSTSIPTSAPTCNIGTLWIVL